MIQGQKHRSKLQEVYVKAPDACAHDASHASTVVDPTPACLAGVGGDHLPGQDGPQRNPRVRNDDARQHHS